MEQGVSRESKQPNFGHGSGYGSVTILVTITDLHSSEPITRKKRQAIEFKWLA
jgi:hypothetical protein